MTKVSVIGVLSERTTPEAKEKLTGEVNTCFENFGIKHTLHFLLL
jgi:hypothetical protein